MPNHEPHPDRHLDPRVKFNWVQDKDNKRWTKYEGVPGFILMVERTDDALPYHAFVIAGKMTNTAVIDRRKGFRTRIHAELWCEKRLRKICENVLDRYQGHHQ